MRQRLALIVAALALVAAPSTAFAVDPTQPAYGGPLGGAQEVPAVSTAATGQGTAVISADGSTITYLVTYSGLSGTANASHFHTGAAGVAGGVILPLVVGPSPMSGTLTAADFKASGSVTTFVQAVAAIRAGTTYFNIHTTANPGGEIRGQIGVTVAAPAPSVVIGKVIGSHGTLMVAASNGMTLYTFTRDVAGSGTSACTGGCLTAWPALTITAGDTPTGDASVTGQLGTITRADNGQTQVTYNGLPLYFFNNDEAPGDTNGIYPLWEAIVLAAPAATPAPTVAPPAPTVPPTSVDSPIVPAGDAGDAGAIGLGWLLAALAASLAALVTVARVARRSR